MTAARILAPLALAEAPVKSQESLYGSQATAAILQVLASALEARPSEELAAKIRKIVATAQR